MSDVEILDSHSLRMPNEYVKGLVSVIIPVYNVEKYIDRTLVSVFSQTYENIEIILVDDQSSDGSANAIKKYQKMHPEIVYYLQPKNMGAGYARNKALELAKGQYVAFLDSDDVWMPGKIERQIKLMKEKGSPFSYTAIEMIDKDDKLIKGKRQVKKSIDYKFLLSNTMIATSSVVIDRCTLGDFRMNLRRGGQDYATWLELLRNDVVACGINDSLVKYRILDNSLSSGKTKSIKQIWEIQTQDEGINRALVVIHLIKWCFNSLKKYYM